MVVGSIPTRGFAKLRWERNADSESLLTLGVYDKPRGDCAAIKNSTASRELSYAGHRLRASECNVPSGLQPGNRLRKACAVVAVDRRRRAPL